MVCRSLCCCYTDHMYRMGLMSLLASDCGVDAQRCIRMALVHDIAEAIVGDITPHCNVTDENKYKLEADAVQQIKQMLGSSTHAGVWSLAYNRRVQSSGRRLGTYLIKSQCKY